MSPGEFFIRVSNLWKRNDLKWEKIIWRSVVGSNVDLPWSSEEKSKKLVHETNTRWMPMHSITSEEKAKIVHGRRELTSDSWREHDYGSKRLDPEHRNLGRRVTTNRVISLTCILNDLSWTEVTIDENTSEEHTPLLWGPRKKRDWPNEVIPLSGMGHRLHSSSIRRTTMGKVDPDDHCMRRKNGTETREKHR